MAANVSPASATSPPTPGPFFTGVGVGSMTTPRYGAAAATLPDGKVLIAGGYNNTDGDLSGAELYDPATGTFTATGSMHTARWDATAAALPDGEVLIAGGYNDTDGTVSSAELYDPATGTFTTTGSMHTARDEAAAAPLPDGRVLIAGGYDGATYLRSAELYDPATGTFATTGSMQKARLSPAASTLPDGEVLIASGVNSPSVYLSSAELFNPATDKFTAMSATMNTAREAAAVTPLPDGNVLIAGGDNSTGYLSSAELFNPATDRFTAMSAAMSSAREGATATTLPDGEVLIAGGYNNTDGVLSSAELYVPAPEARTSGGDFGDQTVHQRSAAQTIEVTNVGAQALTIGGTLTGTTKHDFTITADACAGRTLAFEQTCTITARFTPSRTGHRIATLRLTDNEPSPAGIHLSGTGTRAVHGPRGHAGKVELVTCKTITRTVKHHGHRHRVHHKKCTAKLVSGPVKFKARHARATLRRHGRTYATGTATHGHLVLTPRRKLTRGRYTLIVRHRRHHHWITRRRRITIT